jgi:hypothetical protein
MVTRPSGIPEFERFFREAAGLDVDKDDLKRFEEFIGRKNSDMVLFGQTIASANGRDVIEWRDLPITKGLQESMHRFEKLDGDVGLRPFVEPLVRTRPQDAVLSEEAEQRLPDLAGGIAVALAESLTNIDANLRNPQTIHWERAFHLFDLLL